MTLKSDTRESSFNPEHSLPAAKEWFSIRWLARHWGKSPQHISNQVESGEIAVAVDLRGKHSRRASLNIPRQAVVDFLNRRKK